MGSALERIIRDAMELPVHERLVLAHQLIDTAGPAEREEDDVSPAWESEIQDHIRAIDEGWDQGVCFDEMMRSAELILNNSGR
jgi:hypothetical protein